MRPLNNPVLHLCILASWLLSAVTALAEEERWYRVELLVFSQDSQAARLSETWEPTPVLQYPENGRFLVDSNAVEELASQYDGSSEVNALGHQTITITLPEPPVDMEPLDSQPIPEPADSTPPPNNISEPLPLADLPEIAATTPSPYLLLPHSELEFRGKAAYMQRTGRYQTLFHETWVQPMFSESESPPIIIDHSGDTDTWPELQGSVKLYLSRYLHIETNLWLNTDGSYLPGQWKMPAPPLGPRSVTVIYPPEPAPDPNEVVLVDALPVIDSMMEVGEEEEVEAVPLGPVYPWRHAIVLQQERRMRSTEVHYIDHPMMGVVVKISPLTKEELQERADSEAVQADAPSAST